MITCFEINDRECRIITLSESKGSLLVHNALTVDFPEPSKERSESIKVKSDIIRDAVKKHKIFTGYAVLIAPKQSVTVRLVSLPSTADEEIKQMARFEAVRHIPFNAERHIVSHHVLLKEGVSGSKVIISAVDAPIIEEYVEILKKAGIEIETADVSSIALYNAFLAAKRDQPIDLTTALVHIDTQKTELTLIRKNMIIYTRSTPHNITKLFREYEEGLKLTKPITSDFLDTLDLFFPERSFPQLSHSVKKGIMTEADVNFHAAPLSREPANSEAPVYSIDSNDDPFVKKVDDSSDKIKSAAADEEYKIDPNNPSRKILQEWTTKLIQEIRRTYEFAKREFDCPQINKIYLSGDIAKCKNVIDFFFKNLGVETDFHPAAEAVKPAPKYKPDNFANQMLTYTETIGGACRVLIPNAVKINILPLSYVASMQSKSRQRHIMWVALFSIFALILAGLYVKNYSDNRKLLLKYYTEENKNNAKKVSDISEMEKKLTIIKKEVDNKRSALAILDKISSYPYVTKTITLTDFVYVAGDSVTIGGHAMGIEDLNRFIADLELSGFFKSVRLKQRAPYELPYRMQKVQSFEINCFFEQKKKK